MVNVADCITDYSENASDYGWNAYMREEEGQMRALMSQRPLFPALATAGRGEGNGGWPLPLRLTPTAKFKLGPSLESWLVSASWAILFSSRKSGAIFMRAATFSHSLPWFHFRLFFVSYRCCQTLFKTSHKLTFHQDVCLSFSIKCHWNVSDCKRYIEANNNNKLTDWRQSMV